MMLRLFSLVGALSLVLTGMFAGKGHRVALVSGPAAENRQQLVEARHGIYRSLRESADLEQVILLGNLVKDDATLLAPTRATLDSLSCPWFCVAGSGDRDFYWHATSTRPGGHMPHRERDFATWQKVMPALDTAWTAFDIRWIILNNIRTVRNQVVGGLDEEQKTWLEDQMKAVPERQLVVVCTHFPLSQCAGADSLQRILALHKNTRQICATPCSDPEVLSLSDHGGSYILNIKKGSW